MADMRFDGRVAIVTGAGRGMGAAHATALAARGARVVVNDLAAGSSGDPDSGGAQVVADRIVAAGGQAVAAVGSVATEDGSVGIVQTALDAFGRVDIVVNNAGFAKARSFPDEDFDGFMKHLSVHLAGSFNMTRAAWPHLVEQNYGRVIMVASSAIFGLANHLAYSSAKAGQIGLAKSLSQVAPDKNIKINVLVPRGQTQMTTVTIPTAGGGSVPVPPAADVSPVLAFLAHEDVSVSGEVFATGGGRIERIFLGATRGTVLPAVTPEAVRDNFAEIMDEGGYWVPSDGMQHADQLWAGGGPVYANGGETVSA